MKTKDLLNLARSSRNFDVTTDASFQEEHIPTISTTPTRICAYSRCKCKIDVSEGFRKSQTKRVRLCEEYASFASYDVAFVGDNPTSFEIKHTFFMKSFLSIIRNQTNSHSTLS